MDESFGANALLRAVEPGLIEQLSPRPRLVNTSRNQVLLSQEGALDFVYFPVSGLIGVLAETADGDTQDAALVGPEGGIGIFEACGSRQYTAEALVHVPGRVVRMTASAYRQLFDLSPSLRTAAHRYVEQCISETRQNLVCTSTHDLEARLCRLVLEAVDRGRLGDTLPLTQSVIARMLGAQRTTISEGLARLEKDGLVTRRRGSLLIEDRDSLAALACGCRDALRLTRETIWRNPEPACEAMLAAE
jgi:CRP-like cAMP-binding protein